jgi:hypothetical protein
MQECGNLWDFGGFSPGEYSSNPSLIMKPSFHRFLMFPALVAGFMLLPMITRAQDRGGPPAPNNEPRAVPGPDQMYRHGGWKSRMGQPNPDGPQRPMARPQQFGGPQGPQARMYRHGGWKSRMGQPNADGPQRPMAQPQQFGGPQGPQARMHRQGGWKSRMGQPNPDGPQRPMARPQQFGGPQGPQARMYRHGGWKSRMGQPNPDGPQRPMARPQEFGGPQGPQARMHRHGGWKSRMGQPNPNGQQRPMARPNQDGPQRPMAQPNTSEGQAPPSVQAKPPVQRDQPAVARIRHLRQAAEHLAAAGYAEHAAKARQEIGRMETEMKQSKPAAPPPTDQKKPRLAPRRDFNQEMGKPGTTRTPDANAAMLSEMRKLHKQIDELNARVKKFEAPGAPQP